MKNFLKLVLFGISSSPEVRLVFPETQDERTVGTGFNFTFFLFSSLGGLPLFFKGLWKWGLFMLVLTIVDQYVSIQEMAKVTHVMTASDFFKLSENPLQNVLTLANVFFSFLLGFKGNEWAAKRLFKKGWRFFDPASKQAQKACDKWHLSRRYLSLKEKTPLH